MPAILPVLSLAITAGTAAYGMSQGGVDNLGEQAQAAEARRRGNIDLGTRKINQAFSGFDPQFYKGRAQAYQDFALPELSRQYNQNRNQVGFGLANRGLTGSGAANTQYGDLNQQMTSAKQNIADTGINQAQQLQQQVEQQRNILQGQLYQSADPANANRQAVSTAASFAQPSTFQPLANQFNNLANQYYLSQLINSYKPGTSYPTGPQYTQNPQTGGQASSSVTVGP